MCLYLTVYYIIFLIRERARVTMSPSRGAQRTAPVQAAPIPRSTRSTAQLEHQAVLNCIGLQWRTAGTRATSKAALLRVVKALHRRITAILVASPVARRAPVALRRSPSVSASPPLVCQAWRLDMTMRKRCRRIAPLGATRYHRPALRVRM